MNILKCIRRYFKQSKIKRFIVPGEAYRFHIGCGKDYIEGAINIDFDKDSNADLMMGIDDFDLFPDACANRIESYHFFEHLTLSQAISAVSNWYRMLQSDGELILEMPNLEMCINNIGTHLNSNGIDLAMVGIYGYPPDIDRFGHGFQHKWGWTPNTLSSLLLNAGFKSIEENQVKQTTREAFQFGRDMQLVAKKPTYTQSFRENLLISKSHKLIYCPIPKVACTSFKYLLLNMDGTEIKGDINRKFHELVYKKYSFANLTNDERKSILYDKEYLKFVVVRNPWDRLVSAYVDKFVRASDREDFVIDFMQDIANQRHTLNITSISFQEFIEHILTKDPENLNVHWRPQHYFLGDIRYDVVAKLENIDEDFKLVSSQLAIPDIIPRKNQARVTSKRGKSEVDYQYQFIWELMPEELKKLKELPGYAAWYNGKLKKAVAEYYKKDIEYFSYEFDE